MIFFSDRSKEKCKVDKNNDKFRFNKKTLKNESISSKIKNFCSNCNLNCCSNCSCSICSKIYSFGKSRPYCFAGIISGIVFFIVILIIIIAVIVHKNKEEKKLEETKSKWEEIYNNIGDNDKGTLSEFGAYLKKEASDLSEDGKVNLAYKWITVNIQYDLNYKEKPLDNCFKSRKAVCSGYARLFTNLLTSMGYNPDNIKNIQGYSKGESYSVFSDPKVNHEWNSVKINGKWCLFDATWDKQNSNYAYFCPSPACFARDHLPKDEDSQYQYLDNPISFETFKNYVWTNGYFCQFNAQINPDKAYYEHSSSSRSGSFTIKYNLDYESKLYINSVDGAKFDIKGIDKGFKVDYSCIDTNKQIQLVMFMVDENLKEFNIGSVFLDCKS